jgi:CheY-like chemotaxis protein
MAKILVLDDEPEALRYWWDDLEEAGFAVVRTTTVEQALLRSNADHFDLMVLDRMLPPGEVFGAGVDPPHKDVGTSIVGDLRGRIHLEDVPVIFLTNYPSGDDVEELKNAYNRVEIVSKRTVPSAFTKIVQRTLAERADAGYVSILSDALCKMEPPRRPTASTIHGRWQIYLITG